MRLKTYTFAVAAALLLATPAAQAAVEQYPLQISVEAVVPSPTGLQISPVGDWVGRVQSMRWNMATQRLDPIRQQLDMKSGLGPIVAYLSSEAVLTSAGNQIDLSVSVAGQALEVGAAGAAVVATATEAAASKRAAVEIVAAAPAEQGYAQGSYQGNVFMMFESGTP